MELHNRFDRFIGYINIVFLVIICFLMIYPLLFIVVASISDPMLVATGKVWLIPQGITFDGYMKVFNNNVIVHAYSNTILYTLVGTVVNLIVTISAAYPLSRKDFYGRNVIAFIFVFTMFFSGGLIPTYLLVKGLGLVNTMWALILPTAAGIFHIIIMRTFFQSIPFELQEAASIDGYSYFRILLTIILPLSMPVIAVMILFYSVGHWNSYFNALIYLQDREKYPIQLVLREILLTQSSDVATAIDESFFEQIMAAESIKYASVIVANIPVLLVYPFLQKYFVKGMMIGALKG